MDERIPFTALAAELNHRGVSHSGIQVEEEAVGLCLKVFAWPRVNGESNQGQHNKIRVRTKVQWGQSIFDR